MIERKKAIEEEAERARQQAEQQTIYEAAEARVDEAVESYGEEQQEAIAPPLLPKHRNSLQSCTVLHSLLMERLKK